MLTLAGCFTNISASTYPVKKSFGIVVEFSVDVGDPFGVTVEGAKGVLGPSIEGTLQEQSTPHEFEQWNAVVSGMLSLNIPEPGIYHVVLRSGDSVVHRLPFGAVKMEDTTDGA